MTLRSDHVAGAGFIAFGILILALSRDLPVGQLSMPGSGFLPTIIAALTILFGLALVVRAAESAPFADVPWSDLKHAALVTLITAVAVAFYELLGFLVTMIAMMVALLVIIERRKALPAVGYSVLVVLLTYVSFVYLLKTPMPEGPFGF
jgi:putative tricarboxylic transport membrane protein